MTIHRPRLIFYFKRSVMRKTFVITFLAACLIATYALSASAQTINACYQKNDGQLRVRFRNPAAATVTFDLTFVNDLGVKVGDTSCTIAAGAIECVAPDIEVLGAGKVYIGISSTGAQTSDALFRWRVTLP